MAFRAHGLRREFWMKISWKRESYHAPSMMALHQRWSAPMSDKIKIDVALANLEAGKFSFLMVDAIKDHISSLENELEVVRGQHDSAIRDLQRQELANWRHENELRRLNAQIYALLRANLLTEKAYEGMTLVVMKMGEYFEVSKKFAEPALERAMAELKTGRLQSQCVDVTAKLYALLKAIMPTQSTLEEIKPYAQKTREYLAIAWKFVAAQSAKAPAYLATLYNNVA